MLRGHPSREANKTALDADFQRFITEGGCGLGAPRLHPARALDRDADAARALDNHEELAMHVRATARTGATPADLVEAVLHVAVYAGVPRANHALKIIKKTYAEMVVET